MNADGINEMIEFDCRRLQKLMQLWADPGDTASPVFLALNIMDLAARLRRHRDGRSVTEAELPPDLDNILEQAVALIRGDEQIGAIVFERMSFDSFYQELKTYLEASESGSMMDDEAEIAAADLMDQYFSFELVLDTAEHYLAIPAQRQSDFDTFRTEFATALDGERFLAEAARDFAESAPGGYAMEPWPSLLDQAPDLLFDAIRETVRNKSEIDSAADTINDLEADHDMGIPFLPVNQTCEFVLTASDEIVLLHDQKQDLIILEDFHIALYQYEKMLVLSLAGKDLEYLPEPLVYLNDIEIRLESRVEEDESRKSFNLGPVASFINKTITIQIPGTELPDKTVRIIKKD